MPINTLLQAVVIFEPVFVPNIILLVADVVLYPACTPRIILSLPLESAHPGASCESPLVLLVEPIKIFLAPVEREYPLSLPITVLYEPVMYDMLEPNPALLPINVFASPIVLLEPVWYPKNVLLTPVVLLKPAAVPSAVILSDWLLKPLS